ncbi:MAG: hydroxymethylpyrimidine/phosphomethylpyrimidine kinase [Sphingomonadales bacterium]|nr:hydroxymethylpyrimidine/phosphomethylpyrimidine kinase [Sphingomonadales bacterium]
MTELAKPPRILVIAGSDSGGGAGIQADIKTITMLGGFATTAVTAITAQNTLGVTDVMLVPPPMVIAQIDAVLSDIGVDAVKIGMIGSAETADAVAERLETLAVPIVFDPVMVATSGSELADASTVAAFERLMRIASVVTPNIPELQALGGTEAVLAHGCHLLAKGGHGGEAEIVDALISPAGGRRELRGKRFDTTDTHGTGCTLASALACGLGAGLSIRQAFEQAVRFVRIAILEAPRFGAGNGPIGHQAVTDFRWDDLAPDEASDWLGAVKRMNLNQVTLPAEDYEESVAFYTRLGLRQIVDSPGRYARFECPGGATFSVHVEEGRKAGDAVIYLESDDLDDWVDRLTAAGVAFESGPEDQSWGWREAHLKDPAGNRLCLYRAGRYRRFPPWRVD